MSTKQPDMTWDARWDDTTKQAKVREAEEHLKAMQAGLESMHRMMSTIVSMHSQAVSWADTCRTFAAPVSPGEPTP